MIVFISRLRNFFLARPDISGPPDRNCSPYQTIFYIRNFGGGIVSILTQHVFHGGERGVKGGEGSDADRQGR